MSTSSFEYPSLRPLVKVDSPACLAANLEIDQDNSAQYYSACKCECQCLCKCEGPCNCKCQTQCECQCTCKCESPCNCQCTCKCECQCLNQKENSSYSLQENKSLYLADFGKEAIRNSKVIIKPNLMLRKEDGFGLVFDPKNFTEYRANLTAFEILRIISQGESVDEAVHAFQERYREVPDNLDTIVETFVGQLIKCNGILVQV